MTFPMPKLKKNRRPVAGALMVGFAASFLLCGYEFVRSVSTSLFIGAYGAHNLPFVMTLAPLGTFGMVWGYGVLLSRFGSRQTLFLTSVLSGGGILACYGGILSGFHPAVGMLYVLREAYIVLIIEQYWSFINSVLRDEQGRKYNGPICGIASVGAICGGLIVGQTAKVIGSEHLLIFAGLSLLPAAVLAWWAYGLGGVPVQEPEKRGKLALGLFRDIPTLRYLAGLIFVTQMVSAVLDLRFSGLVETALPVQDERTAYLGHFYALLNACAFVFQFGVAPLLLHFVSLRTAHLGIPVVHLITCGVLLAYPTLTTGALAYLVFKTLDYSVFRAAKELLYIPLSFDARYRAKEVIDAFGYRASKGMTSGLIALAGTISYRVFNIGRLPGSVYPLVALGALGVWGWIAWAITRSGDDRGRRLRVSEEVADL